MKAGQASVRFNQLTRSLVSQSNDIWSFNVSWCRFVTPITDDHASLPHKHSLFEMHVAIEGGLLLQLDDRPEMSLRLGQLVLIPPQTKHAIAFGSDDSCKLVLAFSIQDVNHAVEEALRHNDCSIRAVTPSIQHLIDALRPKLAEANRLTPYIISYTLQSLVLEVLNIIAPLPLGTDTSEGHETTNDGRLKHATDLIACNILYPISGQTLANELGITLRHLNRIFCAAYGHPVNKQIQRMRIAHAQHLLSSTDMSLADIAESMQYSSVYAFIRAFTNSCGVSPGKYRFGISVDTGSSS